VTLLLAEGLRKSYPGVVALDGVTMALEAGSILGLVGHNGAGKSTLTKLLAGAETPDAGRLAVDGVDVRFAQPDDALASGIVAVPQALQVIGVLTVRENLVLGLHRRDRLALGLTGDARSALEAALRSVGVDADLDERADRLRPAVQRLVMLARALLRRPRVLILDEPTAVLGERDAERLFSVVRDMSAAGMGVVYISHRLGEVLALCDRVVVLEQGRTIHEAPTASLTRSGLASIVAGAEVEPHQSSAVTDLGQRTGRLRCSRLARPPKLRPVDLVVGGGEIVGVAGLVGAGRTSLLRVVAGVDRAGGGDLELDGKPVRHRSSRDAVHAGFGLVPEDRVSTALFPELTVAENMTLASLPRYRRRGLPLVDRRRERRDVEAMIRRLGIRPTDPDVKVKHLSGGNQQKVVIARWLLCDTKVLVLDEPTQGVDVAARAEIHEAIRAVAASGAAVLVASAEVEEIVELADRVLVVRSGAIAAEFRGDDITEQRVSLACLEAV
jgi:ribose transport system ATP-binding protein